MPQSNSKLTKSYIKELLDNRFKEGFKKLSDLPAPDMLLDGEKAASRIARAIANREAIAVVGDYDVDGVISTAIMVDFFRSIKHPITAIIPNRFKDGYGISSKIIERIDAKVIVTVDNGITAFDAAKECKERGIDLIVTDHHTPSETLPECYALVNPKREDCSFPYKEICGAQVAWFLIALIKKEMNLSTNMAQFLDLLSIAIIADVMPLVDINRTLVQQGLKAIKNSKRPSMMIIKEFLNKDHLDSGDIGFMIAPRINSAGRMEDASIALDFLTAKDSMEAYEKFEILQNYNTQRKAMEAEATIEAIEQVEGSESVIVVAKDGWHEGVVGIVAARLVQRFGRPAIVLNIENGTAKGSARSLGEVNIFKLIKKHSHLTQKFGGHKMAAGLSVRVENIEKLKTAINADAALLPEDAFSSKDEVLGELAFNEIDIELLDLLETYEPYGEGNPKPRFSAKNAHIVSIKRFGKEQIHAKLLIRESAQSNLTHELLAFRADYKLNRGDRVAYTYTLSKNHYNGRTTVQMLLDRFILKNK